MSNNEIRKQFSEIWDVTKEWFNDIDMSFVIIIVEIFNEFDIHWFHRKDISL